MVKRIFYPQTKSDFEGKWYDTVTLNLQGKVMQLYKLDKNLQQESLTIQSLQREKVRTLYILHFF